MKNLNIYIIILFLIPVFSGNSQCNLDSLGLLPTQTEIDNVLQEWSARDHTVYNWQIVSDNIIDSSRIIIASHEMEGYIHYGLIRMPADTSLLSCPLPVMVYLHGGLNGLYLHKINLLDNYFPPELLRDSMIFIAPSFRSEKLYVDSAHIYYSGGPSTEMDKDADDSMTFLNGVIENFTEVDTTRISLIGFSRGGNVAYKVGIRSPLVKGINVFFSATNLFDPILISDAKTAFVNISNPNYVVSNICVNEAIQPYCDGSINMDEARKRILTWSPAHYCLNLPPTNAFHGTLDSAIPINQSYFIDSVFNYNNPGGSNFQFFEFSNGGHSISSMTGFEQEALSLIRDVITPLVYFQNDTLFTLGEAPGYQWFRNNIPISGETEDRISPSLPGQYKLEFILGNGCSYFSKTYDFLITGEETISLDENYFFYNSSTEKIMVKRTSTDSSYRISIMDINGKILHQNKNTNEFPYSLRPLSLSQGIYFCIIENDYKSEALKILVQ